MSEKHSIKDRRAALSVSRSGYSQCQNTGQPLRAQQTNLLNSLIENVHESSLRLMAVHG